MKRADTLLPITMIERELNKLLRPGVLPLLPYCSSPRHSLLLIAAYKMEQTWSEGYVSVSMNLGDRSVYAEATIIRNQRHKALMHAVGDCVLTALYLLKEKQDG